MLTLMDLRIIDDFLDAPWGSVQAQEALNQLIGMADARRQQFHVREVQKQNRVLWQKIREASQ